MHYHIILTKECNLRCNYCGGGSDTPPKEIQYSISDLKSFLSQDPEPVIEFYGGEPLLRIGTMEQIMDSIAGRFVLQTNGLFLDRIDPNYLSKFHSILVSIDGTSEVTDRERGRGVHDRLMNNLKIIRKRGFYGDLVARMTITEGTDIHENVKYLLDTGVFDHVHWQLDFAMFWQGSENAELGNWIAEYNSGISSLVRSWVDEMSRSGKVAGIVPFLGVMNSLLFSGKKSRLRCGSGIDFFSVMPDGRISACPVSIDFDFSVIGSIFKNTPDSLCDVATIGEPCLSSCDVMDVCGGRCLFVNRSQEMLAENGLSLICTTVKHFVSEMRVALPQVQAFIENGIVKRSDFEYPELNNGCEIIP